MPPNNNQPTVLVKKADGSFVRLTLDEVKKLKGAVPNPSPVPASALTKAGGQSAVLDTPENKPGSRVESVLQKQDAVMEKKASVPADSKTRDFVSPFEDVSPNISSLPRTSDSRSMLAEEVIKKAKVTVAPDVRNRLLTIVQLRLKDVRSAEETRGALTRTALEGGVGLSGEAAQTVLALCEESMQRKPANDTQSVPDIKTLRTTLNLEDDLPAKVVPAGAVATSTPYNAFVHKPAMQIPRPSSAVGAVPTPPSRGMSAESVKSKPTPKPEQNPETFTLASAKTHKVSMHDVLSPVVELGPVDEIRTTTLVDFRRLSASPDEASARLKQQFVNLREESIVLALQAREAWHESPLFNDYITAVAEALVSRKPLGTNRDANKIQPNEIEAIAKMNEEI